MEIQEMTGHIAESNNAMRAASTAMKLAEVELDRRQALIDNYREGVRHQELLISRLRDMLNDGDNDAARVLVEAQYRAIHGPRD
jgi:hypothetical protein